MTDLVTAKMDAAQHEALHFHCEELHLDAPSAHQPLFTIEAIRPLACDAVTVSTSNAVTMHRAEVLAAQQRTPLGTRELGAVQIRTRTGSNPNSKSNAAGSTTYTVPLYQARVAYRRPNLYKERCSLCIVGDATRDSFSKRSPYYGNDSQQRSGGRGHTVFEAKADVARVSFVDLASLTPVSRVMLRCPRTGELLSPTPLFCRYRSSSAAPSSSDLSGPQGDEVEASRAASHSKLSASTHAQHHRRRVVMLPLSAVGETYELVSVIMKRARADDT
ncbi:hypothetical protein ABL78_7737 [Leptomonas seymouri]|uniref:Uncharacterized protein n=1 Tax=Leptomonas seymouri TaxID=5684 RepID=A0A0N1HZ42_LEPSE|nr:hypothetical protein ABL78_7737 [Leptomonas seymouri]|eukprot:KPI83234.1 hypothetical protein ABL78_7737 [Leptomonas seymouri]